MLFKNTQYKALLFDFDGVIANTMIDNFKAWHKALSKFGVSIKQQEYFILEGLKPKDVATLFLKPHGLDTQENILKAVKIKENEYLKIMDFKLYPDVEKLLKKLIKNKIKIAIVTGSSKERFTASIKRITHCDFINFFDEIITATDYQAGKPDPEPYLAAVKKLSIDKNKCLVIENAPLGITSAKKANINVIALCTTLDKAHLSEADYIYKDISNLYKELFGVN